MSRTAGRQAAKIDRLLRQKSGHVHLLGICGVGMAGLAFLLKNRGFVVTGCDARPGALGSWLAAAGVEVLAGHDPGHLAGVDWAVMTPAVALSEPEVRQARERSLPLFARGEVLPRLLRESVGVAVAGTHGKTSTATFVATLLRDAGRDPSWCIGGESSVLGGVAGVGCGGCLVVEADESDGTLALYEPDIAVVTNVELDHLEHFAGTEALEACFRRFAGQARRQVVFCNDDPRARAICEGLPKALSYGLSRGSRVTASELEADAESSRFDLQFDGVSFGRVRLSVPGRHNVLNALAATAAAHAVGLDPGELRAGLSRLGLPRRRFELVAQAEGIRVISDYAHHPSEIAALMKTAAGLGARRVLAVFQPHRYTRTLALGKEFPAAFRGADELVLLPVYAASEQPLEGGTTWDLYRRFREESQRPVLAGTLREAWEYLRLRLGPGDLLLVIGAGDVERIAGWARESLGRPGGWDPDLAVRELGARLTATELRAREPLAPKTSLRVGGAADVWARVGTVGDLAELLRWTEDRGVPVTVLGNGSNVLVGDPGVRGVTVRLAGEFRSLRQEGGSVAVGAGLSARQLLNALWRKGLTGLEFLEGIPGSVGGMLRMNAGAWGSEILGRVSWIRCLNRDGKPCTLQADELEYRYRACVSLEGRIAVEAGFDLERGAAREIESRRHEAAEKRRWLQGLRCAGSIFRNPEGDYAGRLIERAGLGGLRVGGASISPRHANVFVTEPGASAADVRALIEAVRAGVKRHSGKELELEVVLL